MIKRKIDKLLSAGQGKQLIYLSVFCLAAVLAFYGFAKLFFEGYNWQEIVSVFLDPGNFPDIGKHYLFQMLIGLVGCFIFSALLVSVFSNVFDNISEAVRKGERRYKLKNHLLILGNSSRLTAMLNQYWNENPDGKVAVMTTSDVPKLRETLEAELGKQAENIIFYFGERDNESNLASACVCDASKIYIIGEINENDLDSKNIECYELIKKLGADNVDCYLTLEHESSVSVLQYDNRGAAGRLEVVNTKEYEAEQLLVYTDFLPALKKDSEQSSHIVILGTGEIAKAVAFVAAHISHYPNYRKKGIKTKISFIGNNMRKWMDDLIASKPGLFDLSVYSYINPKGVKDEDVPNEEYGDILDIEWEFIDNHASSPQVRRLMKEWAKDKSQILSLIICENKEKDRIDTVLNLPDYVLDSAVAVYMEGSQSVISKAVKTGMYGNIICFGGAAEWNDPLFLNRAKRGMRVNHIYNSLYGDKDKTAEEAWHDIPVAHKFSSIESANSIPLRRRCFDENSEREDIYELEHRRWMMSSLLTGFKALPTKEAVKVREEGRIKEYKKLFIHPDIVDFEMLSEHEKNKDKDIIDAESYICG